MNQPLSFSIGKEQQLPDGAILQADGTIQFPNGLSIQRTSEGGGQIVLPNGQKLKPGETAVLADGTIVQQS
jgi:hypothetical protein